MGKLLFLFLDGVGLGADNPASNPFAAEPMPHLQALLEGRRLLASSAPYEGPRASLLAIDPNLGVPGLPQSATGQAALLTGRNIPALLGKHYGPKPDAAISAALQNGNLFRSVLEAGKTAAFLDAYPPRYFEAIHTRRRMHAAIPQAALAAGLALKTSEDYLAGEALPADFTGQGWKDQLGLDGYPVYPPFEAGQRLATLAMRSDLAFFEYWLTDYIGHHQDLPAAIRLLRDLDEVIGGLVSRWDPQAGLILLTSDHGNLEDLSTRRHTASLVPALLIGSLADRRRFATNLPSLVEVAPAVLEYLFT